VLVPTPIVRAIVRMPLPSLRSSASRETVDAVAGLPNGYSAGWLCGYYLAARKHSSND
jgi:hypothetical protein